MSHPEISQRECREYIDLYTVYAGRAERAEAEVERLRSLVRAQHEVVATVSNRIIEHNRTVRQHGGAACQDEFCRTFKPLIRRWNTASKATPVHAPMTEAQMIEKYGRLID